ERHEIGVVLVDLAPQAFPIELLGAGQVLDPDHDGSDLQTHWSLPSASRWIPNLLDEPEQPCVTGSGSRPGRVADEVAPDRPSSRGCGRGATSSRPARR